MDPVLTWSVVVFGVFGFLCFLFACLALYRVGPAMLKVQVKLSPWGVTASVEMEGRTVGGKQEDALDQGGQVPPGTDRPGS